jgi:hypothetical protein
MGLILQETGKKCSSDDFAVSNQFSAKSSKLFILGI